MNDVDVERMVRVEERLKRVEAGIVLVLAGMALEDEPDLDPTEACRRAIEGITKAVSK